MRKKRPKQLLVATYLRRNNACDEAVRWSRQFKYDWKRAWYRCHDWYWLSWLINETRNGLDHSRWAAIEDRRIEAGRAAARHIRVEDWDKEKQTYWRKESADAYRKVYPWSEVKKLLIFAEWLK